MKINTLNNRKSVINNIIDIIDHDNQNYIYIDDDISHYAYIKNSTGIDGDLIDHIDDSMVNTGMLFDFSSIPSTLSFNYLAYVINNDKKVGCIRFCSHPWREYFGCKFIINSEYSNFLYNLWNGFTLEPLNSDWNLLISSINELIVKEYDTDLSLLYLLQWMSRIALYYTEHVKEFKANAISLSNFSYASSIALEMHMVKLSF